MVEIGHPDATAGCKASLCDVGQCSPGFADCNASAADGCEVSVSSAPKHCGACGKACASPPNASVVCTNGSCAVGGCLPGFGDCNKDPTDGCEIALTTNAANCGTCGKMCSTTNAIPTCKAGTCVLQCTANFGNCNGLPDDGCETDLASSVPHCGKCGQACAPKNAVPVCGAGTCGYSSCDPGFANCDGNDANGCEVDTKSDKQNCGQCGKACAGNETCANGTCGVVDGGTDADDGGTPTCWGNCEHNPCYTGTKLAFNCSTCASIVCSKDPWCCNQSWDSQCVNEAKSFCFMCKC